MERLDSGIVVMRQPDGKAFSGWRMFATDDEKITFNVYRSANGSKPEKLNGRPSTKGRSSSTKHLMCPKQTPIKSASFSMVKKGKVGKLHASCAQPTTGNCGSSLRPSRPNTASQRLCTIRNTACRSRGRMSPTINRRTPLFTSAMTWQGRRVREFDILESKGESGCNIEDSEGPAGR